MLGLQTPVLVFGGTAFIYLVIILLTLHRRRFGSRFNGLFFLYLVIGIIWATGRAIGVTEGLVPLVPAYGILIARDVFAILPILLTVLTFLFFEREGAHKVGVVGAIFVLVIAIIDSNLFNLENVLQANLELQTPEQVVFGLVLLEWAGLTGGALVLAVMDYIRIQRPLHRNRILYWVTATILIGLGEGLTLLPDAWLAQAGAVVRMSGVGLIAYVTLTYYLPNVHAAVRRFISLGLITLVTAGLFLGCFVVLQWAIASLPSCGSGGPACLCRESWGGCSGSRARSQQRTPRGSFTST